MHSPNVQWRKSSYSGSGDNCVEVAETPELSSSFVTPRTVTSGT